MRAMLHGYRRVDMEDEKTGRRISGFSCFVGYPVDGVEGQEVTKVFISDNICQASGFSPRLGEVELDTTPKGKLTGARMLSAK